MARRFLIDGYNLLHALGLAANLRPGQLFHARQSLLDLIANRFPRDHVTVIFDAHQAPPGAPREQIHAGIHVSFADGEADDLIADLLAHDAAPRTLFVVTSDRAVQECARRREARVIESIEFLDDLIRPAPPPPSAQPEKPTIESAADNERWLAAFRSIDDQPDVRRMQHIDPMNPDPGKTKKHRNRPKKKEDQ